MRRVNRRWPWGIAAVMVAVLAASCDTSGGGGEGEAIADPADVQAVGGQQAADELQRLYDQAEQAGENELVIYGSRAVQLRPLFDLFEQRYPTISIEAIEAFGPELQTRLDQEFVSGQHVGDISWTGNRTTFFNADQGRFAQFRPSTAEELDDRYVDQGETYTVPFFSGFGIGYNTDLVSAEEAPQGWRDLLDPRWRGGKICLGNPKQSGGEVDVFTYMLNDPQSGFDEQYLRDLAAQEPRITDGSVVAQNVATGQCEVGLVYTTDEIHEQQATGAPVELTYPVEDGSHGSYGYLALIDGAPHPNAARLFATWMLTPGVADWLAGNGFYATLPGSDPPQGLPPLEELNLFAEIPQSDVVREVDETVELGRQIF